MDTECKPCPLCNGSGRVLDGYAAICTEVVEKEKKCPACRGKGLLSTDSTANQ